MKIPNKSIFSNNTSKKSLLKIFEDERENLEINDPVPLSIDKSRRIFFLQFVLKKKTF